MVGFLKAFLGGVLVLGVKGVFIAKIPPYHPKRIINKNIKFWLSLFDVGV
ncbi:hypothetical protein HPNQ4053_0167 [Helicobacter pylori NQ4053]|uniref:Uncharacterized protein n=1 Tax=Helicobacter pylori NQ4053 TaxID=992027 RepID=J0JCP3_HELPX|nr:hypothetical protein HPNQ4053_0167 [Helicobacter pylori NQ4053]